MELNKLLLPLTKKSSPESKIFLALQIEASFVKAALWTIKEKETEVLKVGAFFDFLQEDKESFLQSADKACSAILLEDQKIEGVIFGLPGGWIEGEKIKEEKKDLLKTLCEKLALKPLGFVISLEALIHFLRIKQGIPPSAIFIQLAEEEIMVSLVILGKILGVEKVARSEDLTADVSEGLARFKKTKEFPSLMILYNQDTDFEESRQGLLSCDWQANFPFLHFPKIETLDSEVSIKAVAIAAGKEVAKSLGFELPEPKKERIAQVEKVTEVEKEREIEKEEKKFGFIQEEDVLEVSEEKKGLKEGRRIFLQGERNFLRKALGLFWPRRVFSKIVFLKRLPLFLLAIPVLILILAVGFWWYLVKAEIKIFATPKILEKELEIKVDASLSSPDFEEKTIPGEVFEKQVSGEKEEKTSGEKLVGEEAKGTLTIFNKTSSEKIFDKGTILIGPDNLKFLLDEEVRISSKSSEVMEEGEKTLWGRVTGEAIASDIGAEYNIAAGSEFSFKEYTADSFSAKAESDFSGGTSRKVKVVSKKDRESLLGKLKGEIEKEAIEKLKEELPEEKTIFEEGLTSKIEEENFNKDIDEEAENLRLKLKVSASVLAFAKRDLKDLVKHWVSKDVPSGFSLEDSEIETETREVKVDTKEASFITFVKISLMPEYNLEQIKKDLAGQSPGRVEEYLKGLPSFSKAEVKIYPKLLGKFGRLPKLASNINLQIVVEE